MRSIEEQRSVEIRPGFSPKPLTVATPEMGTSPSLEPETASPTALLDGPMIQRADLKQSVDADMTVQDGVVRFGK
jgi:hypothetical protein